MTLLSSEIWYTAFFQLKKGVLKNIFVACFNADRKTWSPVGCSVDQLSLEPLQIPRVDRYVDFSGPIFVYEIH